MYYDFSEYVDMRTEEGVVNADAIMWGLPIVVNQHGETISEPTPDETARLDRMVD